jgi:hypothetical protein
MKNEMWPLAIFLVKVCRQISHSPPAKSVKKDTGSTSYPFRLGFNGGNCQESPTIQNNKSKALIRSAKDKMEILAIGNQVMSCISANRVGQGDYELPKVKSLQRVSEIRVVDWVSRTRIRITHEICEHSGENQQIEKTWLIQRKGGCRFRIILLHFQIHK